jgi:phage-related protein
MVDVPSLAEYILHQNYPNPFNPSTKIRFTVPERSDVRITLNDVLGREVSVLFNDQVEPGTREIEIEASSLSSGNYFVKMIAGSIYKIQKITLIK